MKLGPAPAAYALRLDVALRPRDPAALTRFALAVSTPGNHQYGRYLPRGRFAAVFGPTQATIDKVLAVLHADGFATGAISSNHLIIPATATIARAERALGTSLDRYRLASGRIAIANTAAPKLPASIAGAVQAIIGLDTLSLPQPGGPAPGPAHPQRIHLKGRIATGGPVACAAARSAAASQGSWTENQLAQAYSLNTLYQRGDFGNGVTIALFELTTYSAGDIAGFQKCYGTKTPITNIAVKGGTTSNAGAGEAELDIEVVLGLDPKAHLLVYEAANGGTGTIDEYTAIVGQDKAQVMSSSWGVCEAFLGSSAAAAENTVFEQAAAQGQSMVSIPGDEGSEGCLPNDFAPGLPVGLGKGAAPTGVGVDPKYQTAYVANSGNGTVSVVSEEVGLVANFNFGAGSQPFGVAVDPSAHKVFVTLKAAHELVEINSATCNGITHSSCKATLVNTESGSFPEGVAVDPVTQTVYFAAAGFDQIGVMSEKSLKILAGVDDGGFSPDGVAVDVTTNEIYFAVPTDDAVGAILGNTCDASDPNGCSANGVTVGSDPTNVAVDAPLNRVYVSNTDSDTVSVLNGSSGTLIATVHLLPVVAEPFGLAIGPGGQSLLVACASPSAKGRPSGVAVVSLTTNTVTSLLSAGSGPVAVASDPSISFAATADFTDSALILSPLLLDPWDPGTQPFITGVGGTDLTALGPKPTESVWDEHLNPGALFPEGAGGGGISFFWGMPSYQSAPGVHSKYSSGAPCGDNSGDCREVPDVSASADPAHGYIVFEQGKWVAIGGTSAAAPLWAAIIGLLDVQQGTLHKLGFVNPALYKLVSKGRPIVNDVTVGNNDYTTTNGGLYPATKGYDMATGLGTPIGTGLSIYLGYEPKPVITSISPSKSVAGKKVTIRGSGMLWASAVRFGSKTATFTIVSPTEVIATLPSGSGTVPVTVTTPGGTSTPVKYTY